MHTPAPIAKKHRLNTQLVREVYPRTNCKKTNAKPQLVRGFTLMEVIVSSVLIGITLISLASLFVAGKRYILHSRSRMTSGELGRVFLGPLQMDVTMSERSPGAQNGWLQANNCLSSSPTTGCPGLQTIGNIPYTPTYTINDIGGGTTLRRVRLTINWNEPP